jgi:hypothetical protein
VFVRWSGSSSRQLGDVGWAFEYNDRLGRFNCFYCGATGWQEKCLTLPELIKAMSNYGADRPGYDEVKVLEVSDADSEVALQVVAQRSVVPDDLALRISALEETQEILARYGVRGLANAKRFSVPFLWYNMLPGRSVPIRKLAVHLFQLRAAAESETSASPGEIEDYARRVARRDLGVIGIGECFVGRIGSAYVVGISVAVDSTLSIAEGRSIADRVQQALRSGHPKVKQVFVQVEPYEPSEE